MHPVAVGSACACFCVVLITSIVLFACSFSIVELDEYGIIFDNNSQTIEEKPYTSGRYFVGLGRKFKIFPRQLQSIEFTDSSSSQGDSLSAWTADGLSVWLDVSFFFQLKKEHLKALYYDYGENWYASLVRIATAAIKDKSTTFTTEDFFTQRKLISQSFQEEILSRFDQFMQQSVSLENFQLRKITFDPDYEEAIVQKLIDDQQQNTITITQLLEKNKKDIEKIFADSQNTVNEIYAEEDRKGKALIEEEEANAFYTVLEKTVDGYAQLFTDLALSHNNVQKLSYMEVNELANLKSGKAKLLVDIDKPLFKR